MSSYLDQAPASTPRRPSWAEPEPWLAPPRPEDRLPFSVPTADQHRLELQAALIAAGVPLAPGDSEAVRRIAGLGGPVVAAVLAWLDALG
jgi:hypothetical protein